MRLRWIDVARRRRNEHGSVSVESILIIPVIFTIVFGVIQGALYLHSVNVAHLAASSAYNGARAENARVPDIRTAAEAQLALSGGSLKDPNVDIRIANNTVTVRVSGRSLTLMSGWGGGPDVSEVVTGPLDRWVER